MKSKQKGNTQQSYQSLTKNKSQLRTNNKKQQLANHIPLSSTQHVHLRSKNNLKKYNEEILGHSPYTSLPSVGNQPKYRQSRCQEAYKSVNIEYSNRSRQKYIQSKDDRSIYDRLQLGSANKSGKFTTEESQGSSSKENNLNSLNYPTKAKEEEVYYKKRFTKGNDVKNMGCFYEIGQGYQEIIDDGLGEGQRSVKMNRIKRDISSKLQRVCEKVENLSREKDCDGNKYISQRRKCEKHSTGSNATSTVIKSNTSRPPITNANSFTPNLCYSNLVYEPLSQQPPTPSTYPPQQFSYEHYQNQHNDNQIMCRAVESEEERYRMQLEVLELKVIELNRKLIDGTVRIAGLEEQLLAEREGLIRKEKLWLRREHQLLQWIEDNIRQETLSLQGSSPQKPSPQKHSQPPNVVLSHTPPQPQKPLQLLKTPNIPNLPNFLTLTTNLLTKHQDWLNLMNRTPSQELPGTAFRVKQEMNLNRSQLQQLRSMCQNIASNTDCHNNVANNQSEVFLLQSYCPPQQYEISTKRHCSTHKPCEKSSKKSLLAVSESKSTTNNKKAHLTSTHKKSYMKGTGKQNRRDLQQGNYNDRAKFEKQVAKSTRRLDYYYDEVFYVEEGNDHKGYSNHLSELNQVNAKVNLTDKLNLIDQNQPHHYYQLLTLQAITIQSLLNRSLPHNQASQQQILL